MEHSNRNYLFNRSLAFSAAVSVVVSALACTSHTPKYDGQSTTEQPAAQFGRRPASTEEQAYPLNPKFEKALPNEDQVIAQIRDGILSLQGKEAHAHGKFLRGTHAKGVCALADFEVYDVNQTTGTAAQRIRKGLFSTPGKYAAQVRFANADGAINPDSQKDVRAMSFSAQVPQNLSNQQGLMDFAMNNATTFPINDAQIFADLMAFAKDPAAMTQMSPLHSGAVIEALGLGEIQKYHAGHTPYQKMRYWSTVAFALGDDEAVKYSLKPCSDNQAQALTTDADALTKEIARHVQSDSKMSCFDFQVQLLEPANMTNLIREHKPATYWVENAAVEWNESQAPFYTVGRLTLRSNSMVDQNACEQWRINVLANNSATHHGLGSINRARTKAESASSANRRGY